MFAKCSHHSLLLDISYNKASGSNNLLGLIIPPSTYSIKYSHAFIISFSLLVYNDTIDTNVAGTILVKAKNTDEAKLGARKILEAAKHSMAKFLCSVVKETRYKQLKSLTRFSWVSPPTRSLIT